MIEIQAALIGAVIGAGCALLPVGIQAFVLTWRKMFA